MRSLENSSFKDLVEKVDYYQRKPVIERIFAITSGINKGLLFLSLVLGSLTILITFNTGFQTFDSFFCEPCAFLVSRTYGSG